MFYIPLIIANLILGGCGSFLFGGTLEMQVGDEISFYESSKGVITSMGLEMLTQEHIHGSIVAVVRLSEGDNENVRKEILHVGDTLVIDPLCGKYVTFSSRTSYIAKFTITKN